MEFAIFGNCTAHLPGVLRPGTWAMVPHFLFMLTSLHPLSQALGWSLYLGSWTVGLDFFSGDGVLPLTMGPQPVAPKDPLVDMSTLPT